MCGFAGFTGYIEDRNIILARMTALIAHRGPDSDGFYTDDEIALGFRRLSIIDLKDGNQPFFNEDKSVLCVYNGEIYNYPELREELIGKGHTFVSKCDTEVLVHAWEQYGEDLVYKLRGMYSFAIWDKNKSVLYGARDIFGIKPFYYTVLGQNILFGSEIKSFYAHPDFTPSLNQNALLPYLTLQYSATEETFFSGVYKLPPAHYFTFSAGVLKIKRYWDADFDATVCEFEKCKENLKEVLKESVEAHRISDVPVGSFLSGGIDSSYITALLMPEKTFSVGFDYDNFDETDEAKELSGILKIKNYKKMVTADDCFNAISDIQYHMDEPQSNPSAIPLYFLAKLASEQVKVVLSGEGADEIFAGYEWYDDTPALRKYKKLPAFIRKAAARITVKLPYFKGHDFILRGSGIPEMYFIGQANIYSENEAKSILKPEYREGITVKELTGPIYKKAAGKTELEKKQYLDLLMWLPGDILLKADKMSMAHSLELRVPYLDKYVMQFALSIPSKYKINGLDTKYILRAASAEVLPPQWATRPKKGFPVPIRYWLKDSKYSSLVRKYFNADYASLFFDTNELNRLLDMHVMGKANYARKIWTVFVFLVWYKRFFIDEVI